MSALDFAPQQSSDSALVAGGLDVNDAAGSRAFDDSHVEHHARRVRLGHHLDEALRRQFSGATLELILDEARALLEEMSDDWGGPTGLLEGVGWDEERHPRWPSGTPGGLGGQFMRVGQRFSLDGVQYDVAHVVPGGIIAHVATHGAKGVPKTVEFSSKELAADFKPEELQAAGLKAGQKVHVLEKAERPAAEPIKGAKQHTESASFTGTVIDPYVDASTHDPSIAVPEGSDLKPEEWKRFGRVDQLVYAQTMERFGPWKADGAQKLCDSLKAKCDASTKSLLKSAYGSQFGSSTGFTLSLHSIFSHLTSMAKGGTEVEAARTQFEAARYWQAEAANALRWDLYNRVRSPDVSLFHGTSDNSLFTNDIIQGGKPVFSGLSQSQKFSPGAFGSSRLCSPIAIRHVVLATTSAEMYSSSGGYKGEQEVCVADAFRADARSMVIPDSGPGTGTAGGGYTHAGPSGLQKKWLTGVTQHGIGGWALQVFRDSYKDAGANLPVPPEPAMIAMDKSGGKQWVEPPQDAKTFAYVDGAKKPVTELGYAMVDEKGRPKSMQVKQMVEQGLLKPGDYIEGMQGTRYLIVEDKSDTYLGLAYYKITDLGSKVAGTETKNTDTGQTTTAYSGHTLVHGTEVYGFEGGGSKAFKLLKGHYDLPTLSETKGTNFNPSAWVEDAPKNAVFIKDLADGDKFKVGAGYYEVGEKLGNGNRRIKNLEDAELGQINGTYKTPKLLLKSGYTEAGVAELDVDDFFKGSPTDIGAAFETMSPGDVMLVGKTPYTVIEKTQDGKVSAADQEGKLKLLDATTSFTPLMAKPPGWSEPKVGDTLAIDGEKASLTKILSDGTLQFRKAKGGVVKMKVNDPRLLGIFHGDDYTIGTKSKLKDLAPGTLIHGGTGEKIKPYMVVKQEGKQTLLRNLHTGEELPVGSLKSYALLVAKHQPSAPAPVEDHSMPSSPADTFNVDAFEAGPEKGAQELVAGEKFTTNGKFFEVVSNDSGAGGLLTYKYLDGTGKTATTAATGNFPLTTLVPKGEGIAAHAAPPAGPSTEPVGGPVKPSQLEVGDEVDMGAGYFYKVTGVSPLTGDPSAGAHLELVALPNSKDAGETYSQNWKDEDVDAWTLAAKASPSVQTVPATTFDPSAYVEGPVPATADLVVGDVVKAKHGSYFAVTGKTEALVKLKNLGNGKDTSVALGYGGFAFKLTPKTKAHTPYDDLKPSDPVDLTELQPGDQFTYPTGSMTVHQVVSVGDPQSDEPSMKIAPVSPGGHVGDPYAVSSSVVLFHAHAHDTLPPQDTAAMATVLPSPADLPHATSGGFVPFKWHKGGHGTVYTKLQEMAPGAVFVDKNSKGWKILKAGPVPIVVDEQGKLYAANGLERGRHVKYGEGFDELIDKMAGIQTGVSTSLPETEAIIAGQNLEPNDGNLSIKELGLGIGDVVRTAQGVPPMKVTSFDGDYVALYEPASGKTHSVLASYPPAAFKKTLAPEGMFSESIAEVGPAPEKPTGMSGSLEDYEPTGAKELPQNMAPGTIYLGVAASAGSPEAHLMFVGASDPEKLVVFDLTTGGDAVTLPKSVYAGIEGQPELPMMKLKAPAAAKGLLHPSEAYPNASSNAGAFELGILKPGTEFTHEAGPGVVFKVVKHGGKVTTAEVVETPPGSSYAVGDPVNLKSSLIPSTFGPSGSHEHTTIAAPQAAFSKDASDYEPEGGALLSQLAPGDFFKTATGKVFKVTTPTNGPTTSIVNGDGEVTPAVSTQLAVTKLAPLAPQSTGSYTPAGLLMPNDVFEDYSDPSVKWKVSSDYDPQQGGWVEATDIATGEVKKFGSEEPIGKIIDNPWTTGKLAGESEVKPGIAHPMFMTDKPLADVQVGESFTTPKAAYTLLEPLDASGYYGKVSAKMLVLKGPKAGQTATVKFQKTATVKPLLPGMPLWKPSEFAKVVKPGNKSGKTVKIVSVLQTDNGIAYLVRQADGKGDQVPETWLQSLKGNPTWKTVQTLATGQVQADEVEPGSIVKQVSLYQSTLYLAGDYDGSYLPLQVIGSAQGYAKESKMPGSTMLELVMSAEDAAKMIRATAKAEQSGHASLNVPAMPSVLKLPSNDEGKELTQLEVGDKFELPDGSVWTLTSVPTWSGDEASAEMFEPGSTYSTQQGWKHGAKKQFAAKVVPVGVDPFNPSGLDPEYAADAQELADQPSLVPNTTGKTLAQLKLSPGDTFGYNGQVFTVDSEKGIGVVYAANASGHHSGFPVSIVPTHIDQWEEASAGAPIPGLHPGPWVENVPAQTGTSGSTIDNMPEGTQFEWDGVAYEVLPWTEQSEDDPATQVRALNGPLAGQTTTFGEKFKPSLVKFAPGAEIGKPNWTPGEEPEPDTALVDAVTNLAAKLHDATTEHTVDAKTLNVGDHFVIGAVPYVVLSKTGGGALTAHRMTPSPKGQSVLQEVGAWTPVKKIDDALLQKPLNALPDGAKFTTGVVSGVPGGKVWTKTKGDQDPSKVWAKSGDGKLEWFGNTLPVTPLPASAVDVKGEESVPLGSPVTSSTVQVGDHYKTPAGNVFQVVDKTEDTQGAVTLDVRAVHIAAGALTGDGKITPNADSPLGVRVEAPDEPSSGAAEPATTEDYDPLVPYKWHKGGHGQVYVQLKTLAAGATFKDKAGKTYTIAKTEAEGAAKGYVHYTDAAGAEFVTLSKNRVHAL